MNKKHLFSVAACIVAVVVLTGCSGCATLDKLYTQVAPPMVTNLVAQVTPPILDASGAVVTPAVTNLVPMVLPAGPGQLQPNPIVQGGVVAVSAIPVPYAGLAGAVLLALYQLYMNLRNKKLSGAMVDGIEAFRGILQNTAEGRELDSKLKDFLQRHAEIQGVLNPLAAMVNNRTGNTVP